MAKTLGCLVGAMTVGAVFLHWIEPASSPADNGYAVQLRALEVKQAVQPNEAVAAVRWRGVIIRADGKQAGEPHFRVTSRGELIKGEPWMSQQDLGESGFIEVSLDAPKSRTGAFSQQQANTLVALLSELRREYVSGGGGVQFDERSFAADGRGPAFPQTQRLKELLQAAGLNS